MSSKHQNINFAIEKENVGSLSYLNVKNCCKNDKYVTSVYRKPTFSGAFQQLWKFYSNAPKERILHTLFHRSFSICCDFKTFHSEIDHLKTILIKKIIPGISKIRVLNHFLINYIHLKLWFRMYLKEMFLLSCRSWEVLRFKFEISFKNYLVINRRLVI